MLHSSNPYLLASTSVRLKWWYELKLIPSWYRKLWGSHTQTRKHFSLKRRALRKYHNFLWLGRCSLVHPRADEHFCVFQGEFNLSFVDLHGKISGRLKTVKFLTQALASKRDWMISIIRSAFSRRIISVQRETKTV